MSNPQIEEFSKKLINAVRDAAIRNCDNRLHPDARDPVSIRWKKAISEGNPEALARVMIPDIVDSTIAQLCRAIDQELLQLSFTASDGKSTILPVDGDGELCGWYMGSDGWRSMYSKERFIDDFSDLK
jgi:hypothetical protein